MSQNAYVTPDDPRQVFASTSCLRNMVSLESQLAEYVAASMRHIELGLTPQQTSPDLLAMLKATNAQFLLHNYFPAPSKPFVLNLASQDTAILNSSISLCKQAISLCGELKAAFYSVHVGFRADFTPESLGKQLQYRSICPYGDAYQTFLESVTGLLAFGKQRGVSLLVEPDHVRPSILVNNRNELALLIEAREILRLMRDVNDSALGVLLDTGHLNVSARTLGFDRLAFVEQIAPHIRAFHVHDNDGSADTHTPVCSGSWVLEVLKRKEFSALPLIVEAQFPSVADLLDHVTWFKRELERKPLQPKAAL